MNEFTAFLSENAAAIIWLAIAVALGVLEAITVDLVSVWFAIGAFITAIAAGFGATTTLQLIIFVVVSSLALLLTRKFVKGVLKVKKTPTNADSVVGREGIVIEDIDNIAGTGRIHVSGLDWTARSAGGENIHIGETVAVEAIQGVKLIVRSVSVGAAVK